MHTLHWIAIEAESREEAEESVISQLLNSENNWWDWFDETIGGRWRDGAKTICATDLPKYDEAIDRIITNRKTEVKEYMERTSLSEVENLINDYDGESLGWDYQMNFYRLKQITKLMGDDYFHGSYFYDLENWTPSLNYLRERVAKDSANQYLVPIDFHF